jgi:hypothetical protein
MGGVMEWWSSGVMKKWENRVEQRIFFACRSGQIKNQKSKIKN